MEGIRVPPFIFFMFYKVLQVNLSYFLAFFGRFFSCFFSYDLSLMTHLVIQLHINTCLTASSHMYTHLHPHQLIPSINNLHTIGSTKEGNWAGSELTL